MNKYNRINCFCEKLITPLLQIWGDFLIVRQQLVAVANRYFKTRPSRHGGVEGGEDGG
jgi:hypothetical protein